MCMHTFSACDYVGIHADYSQRCLLSPSVIQALLPWDRVSQWSWNSLFQVVWVAREFLGSTSMYKFCLALALQASAARTSLWHGDLNSCPHTCTGSTWTILPDFLLLDYYIYCVFTGESACKCTQVFTQRQRCGDQRQHAGAGSVLQLCGSQG